LLRYTIFPDCYFEGCVGCPKDWYGNQSD